MTYSVYAKILGMKKFFFLLFLILGIFVYYFVYHKENRRPIRPVILTLQTAPVTQEEINYLKEVNPYGILLFEYSVKGCLPPLPLKKELQKRLNRPDLLFFIDQEGGTVNRLKGLFRKKNYPPAKEFGDLAQKDLLLAKQKAYKYGKETGQDLRLHGFDVNFAPAAELCVEKGFLKTRCFSSDPHITAELADSFAQGLADAKVEPVYKHAPGIATGKIDPHSELSLIKRPLKDLLNTEVRAMKNAGKWKHLMIGHAIYTAIDPHQISTYSPQFYNFVRKNLNFNGLIITDALNMKTAILPSGSRGEQMYKALEAGADIVMPFFDNTFSFDKRLQEINKITPEQIQTFNKKLAQKKAPVENGSLAKDLF